MAQPIDLYYWPTPNGWKVTIFLEEAGLPYELVPVDITSGDQFEEEFLRISPNNKMPAIVDPDGPDGPYSFTWPRRRADSCRNPCVRSTWYCSG